MRNRNLRAVGVATLFVGTLSLTGQTGQAPKPFVLQPRSQSTPAPTNPSKASSQQPQTTIPQQIIPKTARLAAGQPLRIQLDHRVRMRAAAPIVGRLIDPVYSEDHVLLPANCLLYGTILRLQPIRRSTRTWALLDGDVTPLKRPVLTFDSLQLPDGKRVRLTADATERTAAIVKMSVHQKKQSLFGKLKSMAGAKIQGMKNILHDPHKSDSALKLFYGQLPYHPQDIWAGTQFDAGLAEPVSVPDPMAGEKSLPVTPPHGRIPPGTLDARLVTPLSSATDKIGKPIEALLTQPYLNATKTDVILPTGTRLTGEVTQAKTARSFSRNGILRFAFRQVELPSGALEQMHGQMTAVEGSKGQNVTVDSEGGAHANSDQGQFLAPLLLGAVAASSFGDSQDAVSSGASSNGFGLVARIAAFVAVAPAVTGTFAYYSLGKSITRRWLMPGHQVVFAKNTRMELAVADR